MNSTTETDLVKDQKITITLNCHDSPCQNMSVIPLQSSHIKPPFFSHLNSSFNLMLLWIWLHTRFLSAVKTTLSGVWLRDDCLSKFCDNKMLWLLGGLFVLFKLIYMSVLRIQINRKSNWSRHINSPIGDLVVNMLTGIMYSDVS